MNDYLIPWERRRKVPWNGFDVFALLLFYIVSMVYGASLMLLFRGPVPPIMEVAASTQHALSQFIQQSHGCPPALFVAFFSAVVAAPLGEEFFFRLVLQGWLEKQETLHFRRRFLPHGLPSIVFAALFFAVLHGGSRKELDVDTLFFMLLGNGIANVGSMLVGIVFLRGMRGATWNDLGLRFHRLPSDFGWAILFFVLFVPSIILLNVALRNLLPETVTDPIPLFFFALALGFLFYRTRRLAGCVLLHAMLNGFSFLVVAAF